MSALSPHTQDGSYAPGSVSVQTLADKANRYGASVDSIAAGSTLVAQAGTTMDQVVVSVSRVTDRIFDDFAGAPVNQRQINAMLGIA